MTKKIFHSMIFVSLAVLIASLALITGVLFDTFESQLKKELEQKADYLSYAVETEGSGYIDNFKNTDSRITLIASDGKVIADTSANPANMDNHSNRKEFKDAIESGVGTSVRYSDTLTEKTVYYAKRLKNGDVLRISTTQYTVASILLGLMQPTIYVILAALILAFLLSSKASKSITKPINEIDLDNPDGIYDELSPFLYKIKKQNKIINTQIEQARKMQEEFKLITENMSEGILIIDKTANLLSCNSAAMKLLDGQKSSGNVLELNRSADFRKAIESALGGKRCEILMPHDEKTYSLIVNPALENGGIAGAVIVILDVTEREKRDAMRREFTANVSHELKTPLTSISGFAELMKDSPLPPETVKDFSNSIYSEAQRLITLVSDIIKISELDEKNADYTWENVDLFKLSQNIIERLKLNAGKKNIALFLSGDTAEVYGVRRILDEIIYNLCDNAIKYNKENGNVDITIKKETDKIILTVSDSGIGIPKSQQDRIFERFYRVDKSRSKNEGGTGLGLSIVKHGVMFLGAQLSLESKPEQGTTVTITFDSTREN